MGACKSQISSRDMAGELGKEAVKVRNATELKELSYDFILLPIACLRRHSEATAGESSFQTFK